MVWFHAPITLWRIRAARAIVAHETFRAWSALLSTSARVVRMAWANVPQSLYQSGFRGRKLSRGTSACVENFGARQSRARVVQYQALHDYKEP
jgi:hypothetical protein